MSRFDVSVLPRAQSDVQTIFDWIGERSPQGASTWYASFESALLLLKQNADSYGEAVEASHFDRPLKQCLFKTAKGRTYRFVFLIEGDEVFVLRVRGPGQPTLTAGEF